MNTTRALSLSAAALAATTLTFGAVPALAADSGSRPSGNNGTVKIDEYTMDAGTDNDPHVSCDFSVNFFGYDSGAQQASISISPVSPTKGKGSFHTSTSWDKGTRTSGSQFDQTVPITMSDLSSALAGVTPQSQQGYHLRLDVEVTGSQGSDDKYKTFWLQPCPSSSNGGSNTGPASSTPGTSSGSTSAGGTSNGPATPSGPGASNGPTTPSGPGTATGPATPTGPGTASGPTGSTTPTAGASSNRLPAGSTAASSAAAQTTAATPGSAAPASGSFGTAGGAELSAAPASHAPSAISTSGTGAAGSLAFTGADVAGTALVGLGLIGLGTTLAVRSRRRAPADS